MQKCSDSNHNLSATQAIMVALPEANIQKLCNVYKALGEPSRIKIVLALLNGPMCVYHITQSTNLKQSLTSHQLRILKGCGIVSSKKEGRLIIYSICDSHIKDMVIKSMQHLECI